MIVLFLFLMTPLFGQSYFESDGLGIAGASVKSVYDAQWVLEITETEKLSSRKLFKEQSEYKRWDRSEFSEDNTILIREAYYYKGSLRTETIQMRDGRITEEISYDSTGTFLNRKEYSYDQDRRLISITTHDQEGLELKKDELLYRFDNSLRRIEGDDGSSTEWRTGDFNKQYLDVLLINENKTTSVFRFKNNDLIHSETTVDGIVSEEISYEYDADHRLLKEQRIRRRNNEQIDIFYNTDGDILTKNVYENESLKSTESNFYTDKKLVRTIYKSRGLKLETVYEYENEYPDPVKTSFYRNGIIVRQTESTDDGVVETLFRNGIEVLKRPVREDES